MKKIPGSPRFASSPFRQAGIEWGALLLAVVTLSAGCGHKSEQTASPAPQASADAASQPAATPANQAANQPAQANQTTPQAANQTAATAAPPAEPDLGALNRALRSWVMANRRPPKSFDDFAASAGVPIPAPPPGKHYVLTGNMHIQLVNQ